MATHPLVQAMWETVPLSRFSVYSQMQFEATQRLAKELRSTLDRSIEGDVIDGDGFQHIYGQFWLWVVATYEIARDYEPTWELFRTRTR